MKKTKTKTEKGITLIALIITIVVLLILAIVAIGAVRDSGIIGHAQNAASGYNTKKDEEGSTISGYEVLLDQYGGAGSGSDTVIPTDASYFNLNEGTSSVSVVGLTDAGKQLTDIIVPSTYNGKPITAIASCAFQNCPNLKTITIPGSVISITDYMVYGSCPNLTDVYCEFPEARATSRFPSNWDAGIETKLHFKEAEIPETQKYFAYTLDTTTNTATITGLNSQYAYSVQSGYHYYYTAINDGNNNYITDIVIPSKIVGKDDGIEYTVTTIGSSAFLGGGDLAEHSFTNIVIPNTVTTIGEFAFQGCKKLTSIVIPDSVETIESGAFWNCLALTTISLPSSLTTMGDFVFEGATSDLTINVDKLQSECSDWGENWAGNANVVYKTAN